MPPARPALVAFAVVLGGGVVLGETFPFSRFSMYAGIEPRDRGATPVFLADGALAAVEDFDGFEGLDPEGYRAPEGIPSTMDYLSNDMKGWVRAHARAGSPEPREPLVAPGFQPGGPCEVRAELGWVISTRGDDGIIAQTTVVQSSGRACRR